MRLVALIMKIAIVLLMYSYYICSACIRTYLPSGRVSPEIGKGVLKPVVDLVQAQLVFLRVQNGLEN